MGDLTGNAMPYEQLILDEVVSMVVFYQINSKFMLNY